MTSIMKVQIVRPYRSWTWIITRSLKLLVDFLVLGLVIRLIAPTATGGAWNPGFTQAIAVAILILTVFPRNIFELWTEGSTE